MNPWSFPQFTLAYGTQIERLVEVSDKEIEGQGCSIPIDLGYLLW